jgi:hypothetical protein
MPGNVRTGIFPLPRSGSATLPPSQQKSGYYRRGRKKSVLVRAFVLRVVGSHMSASIPQVELNSPSIHSRLPEWFVRELEARNRAPRRRVAVWRSRTRPVGNFRTTIHPRKQHRQFDDPEYRRVRIAALASVKQIATAHGYKERMQRRDLGADTRWASNELPPHSSFLEPDPRRERRAIVDGIFRSIFYGGDANECGPATLKRGTQKKSGDDCHWSR